MGLRISLVLVGPANLRPAASSFVSLPPSLQSMPASVTIASRGSGRRRFERPGHRCTALFHQTVDQPGEIIGQQIRDPDDPSARITGGERLYRTVVMGKAALDHRVGEAARANRRRRRSARAPLSRSRTRQSWSLHRTSCRPRSVARGACGQRRRRGWRPTRGLGTRRRQFPCESRPFSPHVRATDRNHAAWVRDAHAPARSRHPADYRKPSKILGDVALESGFESDVSNFNRAFRGRIRASAGWRLRAGACASRTDAA